MQTQLNHHVVDCPICGRPVEVSCEYAGHELACGHCRGAFVVHEPSVDTSPADDQCEAADRPVALLVEHRDEVFARIAADMAHCGMRVIRACSAIEALKLFGANEPTMVVANVDLPDQNGWMLAGKVRFIDSGVRIWVYQPHSEPGDDGMAEWLEVDELLDYGGDLLGLSETIVQLMTDQHEPSRIEVGGELAVA